MVLPLLRPCRTFFGPGEPGDFHWDHGAFLPGSHRPQTHGSSPAMTFLRKSSSLLVVWIKLLATAARRSFGSGSRSHGTNFATTGFVPGSCDKISDTVVSGTPSSASSPHTVSRRSLLTAAHTCSTVSGVLLGAGLPERGSLSTDSRPSLKRLCHACICAALIASSLEASWMIRIVSAEESSSLTQNLMHVGCSARLFWMGRPHSAHAHSMASTAPTD